MDKNKNTQEVEKQPESTTVVKEIIEWIKAAAIALFVFLIINIFLFPARVDGDSMLPNFEHGDRLIVNRLAYKDKVPEYEDIVIFYCETKNYTLIKRVIGVPGDQIEIKDGKVYRNGTELNESRYLSCETIGNINTIVEEGHVFVLGDNRPDSADSRYAEIGQIPLTEIKGKVLLRLFPNPKIIE